MFPVDSLFWFELYQKRHTPKLTILCGGLKLLLGKLVLTTWKNATQLIQQWYLLRSHFPAVLTVPLIGKVQAKKSCFHSFKLCLRGRKTTKIGLSCRVNAAWWQIFRSSTCFNLQIPFNHLLINEAGGWTLENINGNGRLKAELRKNSQSCKRIIFYVKVRI